MENTDLTEENTELAEENAAIEKRIAEKTDVSAIHTAITGASISITLDESDTEDILAALGGIELYTKDADGNEVVNEKALDAIGTAIADKYTGVDSTVLEADKQAIAKALASNQEYTETYEKRAENLAKITENTAKIADNTTAMEKNDAEIEKLQANIEDIEAEIKTKDDFLKENAVMDEVYLLTNDIEDEAERQVNAEDLLGKMAISADEAAKIYANENDRYSKGNATKVEGSDAKIILNNVEYTSDSNSFSINGLTINALAKTTDEITINTSIDTQGIYDKVKDFLTEYNNVINEMCKLYNAESASDYEPLTDEEKEAMSDEQIEKWETKIKDSLLRRDTTLNTIMSAMVNSMAQTFEIDGQKLSLSTFGIQTLGFLNAPKNEHYAYHIDGDEDDENTSGKKDKLMEAIETNPDQVEAFMKKLSETLYTAIDNKMKSTELSSAYKVYNDKEMDRELAKYAETISKWEEKVKDKEDYYYKQFSNMEVALSKLQNQTSSLAGLLGQ